MPLKTAAGPALVAALACTLTGSDPFDNLAPLTMPAPAAARAERLMVSAASPHAVEAGLRVLQDGGNALDAAIAVQMVLGFVEAPETGIGGGGFLLYRDAGTGTTHFYDGRERAPAAATADRFTVLGFPVPRWAAIPTGRAVGVPGLVAMLELAHARHGSRPWAELLAPAIKLARTGVPMPPRLQRQIRADASVWLFSDTRHQFYRQARRRPPMLANPDLADTLERLAAQGAEAFYHGPLAEAIVTRVRNRWPWAGDLSVADLAGYRALERRPVCGRYRGWTVCGPSPPSSGAVAVLQILGILEQFPLPAMEPLAPETIHLIAEASRLAFADRNRYLGDPHFVQVPVAGLIDPRYLATRAAGIDSARAMAQASPGNPGTGPNPPATAAEPDHGGTSHFAVVDGEGNAVALTSSIEVPFGSRMMVQGFLLNNQLTDFSFAPARDGQPHPNAPAPGKRPRSSMAPIIVTDDAGSVRLVIGSRGGSRIIGYVVKALLGVLDWGMDIQHAIHLPNFLHQGDGLELERGTRLEHLAPDMVAMGHDVRIRPLTSGLHGIERVDGHWRGGADPRLDGVARGE